MILPAVDLTLILALLVALLAGTVRGFSGFGGALIFVPLVSALYEPARASPTLWVIDVVLTLPMTYRAMKLCAWRAVLPMAAVAALTTPLGVYALTVVDPVSLRWTITAAVGCCLALLMSGLRYTTKPGVAPTVAVGAISGFLGGSAQLSGAPVATFWLGGPGLPAQIRANLIAYFGLLSIASGLAFAGAGLFTADVGGLALWLGPVYGLGVVIGGRRFVGASDAGYRRIAYTVIALAAVLSAPAWDGFWR